MGVYDLGTARGKIVLNAAGLTGASTALRKLGIGLLGVGGLAIAGFGVAVKQAADFEKIMSGAQSALGATDADMNVVKKTALDLGAKSIYGAKNVGKAIEALAYAGLTIKEIVGGAAKATIDLAQASGGLIDLDTAGTTVVNTMRTFGLEAKDAGHIADELAGAANRSTIDIRDIVVALKYVGPVANSAGIGLDSVSEALALLGDRGIRGSTAGTSLRGVMLGLIAPSVKAKGVLKDLGLITKDGANLFFDASGKMKSFGEISQVLQDHTRGLTREQKEAAFATIFQRRAMASALVLSEAGAKGFQHYAQEIKRGGSASEIAAKRLDNLHGDVALLKSQIETTLIRAGTPFQEMLRSWVRGLTGVVKWFANLSPGTQKFILQGLLLVGVLFSLMGAFILIVGTLVKAYKAYKDVRLAITMVTDAVKISNLAFLASPWFWVILAIVALIAIFVLLWIKVKGFRDFWKAVWRDLKGAALAAWHAIEPAIKAIGRFFTDTLPNAIGSGVKFIKDHWKQIGLILLGPLAPLALLVALFIQNFGKIKRAVVPVIAFIGKQLASFGDWLGKNVMPVFSAFGDLVVAVFNRVREVIGGVWKIVYPILRLWGIVLRTQFKVGVDVIKILIAYLKLFATIFVAWVRLVAGVALAVWGPLWQIIQTTVLLAFAIIRGAFNTFMAIIRAIWNPFWNVVGTVVQAAWGYIKNTVEGALKIIKGIIQVVTGLISGDWGKVWEGIKNILTGAWQVMTALIFAAIEIVKSVIFNGFTAVVNFFTTVPGAILGAIGDVASLLWQKGWDIIKSLGIGIQSIWHKIIEFFTGIGPSILGFIGDLGHLLYDIGKSIIGGLIDGIKYMATGGPLKSALSAVGDLVPKWKGPPDKDKRLLVNNGRLIIGGLVAGIGRGLPGLKKVLGEAGNFVAKHAPTLQANVIGAAAGRSTTGPPLSRGGDHFHFDFKFGDNVTQETVAKAKKDLKEPKVLRELIKAVRAGSTE